MYLDGPDIEATETSFAAAEGVNTTLVCGTNLVGNPVPSVHWRDSRANTIDTNDTAYIFNNGQELVTLTILQAQLNDSGNWTCVLSSNVTGNIVERMLALTVIGK